MEKSVSPESGSTAGLVQRRCSEQDPGCESPYFSAHFLALLSHVFGLSKRFAWPTGYFYITQHMSHQMSHVAVR
jgi:hypothetical protein